VSSRPREGRRNGSDQERAVVVHPVLPDSARATGRSPEAQLAEAVGLAEAIFLDIAEARVIVVRRPRPGTLFGRGVVDDLAQSMAEAGAGLLVVDAALTPVQQRNLERALDAKVIDRTALILEIFGERARTREGALQVELAHLTYQRSRLVRSWTHLERQRGALGFVGGPGETQIELDRRLIDDRITRIRKELDAVKRTRGLHRRARRRAGRPVIALVGYTNAGKSTLFNRLTRADAMTADMLFATLDPTMHAIKLPSGCEAVLSDTVGFISDLPHDLIAAFRATLEEVTEADLVLHVRDGAHPDGEAQRDDVLRLLVELGLGDDVEETSVEAVNKVDLLSPEASAALRAAAKRANRDIVPVSAVTGEGCDDLMATVDRRLSAERTIIDVALPFSDGATLAWLYRRGEVLTRDEKGDRLRLRVRLDAADAARFQQRQGHRAGA